ncbi:hypothetical protein HMPREF0841_1762 [Streptococcus pyogenes ATCC 10782]|nr:hypothetical protein HMPREF0841_1762 [Streptococcus pyogenes ATCC 10782]
MLLIRVQLITEIYDEVIPEQQKCDQILLIKIKNHLTSMNKVSSARCWNFVHHRNSRVFFSVLLLFVASVKVYLLTNGYQATRTLIINGAL